MNIEMELPRRVGRFIVKHSLINRNDTLLVGVSGGTDSVCLLHILIQLQDTIPFKLHIVHLNHQLRESESDADAAYVIELAKRFGVPSTVGSRNVKEDQLDHRCSLEETAREVRYDFFAQVANQVGAKKVAVGHTAVDQAETVIMHMIRGTGLSGLQGMRPSYELECQEGRKITLIRPLLEVMREETYSYCEQRELNPRFDSSNLSPEHTRNRIRNEVFPILKMQNPNIVQTVNRMANLIVDDVDYLEEEVDRVYESVIEVVQEGIALDNESFNQLHRSLQRRLLRKILGQISSSLKDIEMTHIENIMQIMVQPAGKELSLPRGISFFGDYRRSFITRGENPLSMLLPIHQEVNLNIPGETLFSGWKVMADAWPGGLAEIDSGDYVAFFDLDLTGSDIIVRARRDGDRFQPLGMEESKKLQDFMVDAKIPRVWRDSIPLVCAQDRIIWVVGWRTDHLTRINDFTQRTLRLEFEMQG